MIVIQKYKTCPSCKYINTKIDPFHSFKSKGKIPSEQGEK